MFQQSLLQTSPAAAGVRRRSTFIAVSLQTLLLAATVILPRMYVEQMPSVVVVPHVPMPKWTGYTPTTNDSHSGTAASTQRLLAVVPTIIPLHGRSVSTESNADATDRPSTGPNVIGGSRDGVPGLPDDKRVPVILVQPTPVKTLYLSHLDPGMLINRVEPVYPRIAIMTRQQGVVVLQAVIAKDGRISELHALQGPPPLLIQAALNAVSQWRYKPYVLNGQAVPVQTEIRVNFALQK